MKFRNLPAARGRSENAGNVWPLRTPFATPRLLFLAALLAREAVGQTIVNNESADIVRMLNSGLFKCNLRRIADYPNLTAHLERMLGLPGIASTVNIDHIKRGYYLVKSLNPTGIVPVGPELGFAHLLAAAAKEAA